SSVILLIGIPAPFKADDKTVFEFQKKVGTKEGVVEAEGDLGAGESASDIVVENEYYDGYKAHSTIETHSATAVMEGDKLIMWVSSQTPFGTREAVSKELGMPLEKVHVKENFLGGGFGGKIYNPQAIEAAKLAKITGKPIQLSYTRREEFMYDYFRNATTITIKSGCNNDGKITLWDYDVYFAGARGSQIFYDFPNKRVATRTNADGEPSAHPFPVGAWRAPHNNSNTFARESHIDVMAHKLGIDPVEFRLKNTKNERVLDTIKTAVDAFGWTPIKSPSGKGVGIAVGFDAGSYVATIAEVEVNKKTGEVMPIRMVCAQDCGLVVNPLGTKLQVEGGLIMGLGYALTEDVEFDWGEVKTRNFDTYEIARFSRTPVVEAVLVDSRHEPPEGGGEPSIITAGGAVANAIFDACGARLHQMPMTPERVLEAMKAG
ncbi:xanthine dehydrogenase family protein molybdopterin-binding subunit, partial [Bacteroidota bacterium]